MKKLFLALLALPLMQGMASAQGNAQAGKALWDDGGKTQCRNCHGSNGEGAFGPDLAGLPDGVGLLPGSACPHYDGDPLRRPVYHRLVARGSGVVCGIDLALDAFRSLDPKVTMRVDSEDGARVVKGDSVLYLSGHARALLAAERVR